MAVDRRSGGAVLCGVSGSVVGVLKECREDEQDSTVMADEYFPPVEDGVL